MFSGKIFVDTLEYFFIVIIEKSALYLPVPSYKSTRKSR